MNEFDFLDELMKLVEKAIQNNVTPIAIVTNLELIKLSTFNAYSKVLELKNKDELERIRKILLNRE